MKSSRRSKKRKEPHEQLAQSRQLASVVLPPVQEYKEDCSQLNATVECTRVKSENTKNAQGGYLKGKEAIVNGFVFCREISI